MSDVELRILGELSDVKDLPEKGNIGDGYIINGIPCVWMEDNNGNFKGWIDATGLHGPNCDIKFCPFTTAPKEESDLSNLQLLATWLIEEVDIAIAGDSMSGPQGFKERSEKLDVLKKLKSDLEFLVPRLNLTPDRRLRAFEYNRKIKGII